MKHLTTIQELLSPSVECLIWITEGLLKENPAYLQEINYIFDGLINNYLQEQRHRNEVGQAASVFMASSFGKQFSLIHIPQTLNKIDNKISESLAVIPGLKHDSRILILCPPLIKKSFTLRGYSNFHAVSLPPH